MPSSMTFARCFKRAASFAPVLLALFMPALHPSRAPAQTTIFTYQGQLTEAGGAANGDYDLQFGLFDAEMAGTQIGATQMVPAVPVSGGLFTVQLDFGVDAFPGVDRFLEIGLQPAGGEGFATLAPRQQISWAPYAIRTLSAATADALSTTCANCVQDAQIQSLAGSKVSGTIPVASVPAGSGNYIQNRTTEQPGSNFNVSGNGVIDGDLTVGGTLNANIGDGFIQNRTTQQTASFNVDGNGTVAGNLSAGAVGIGTTNPQAKLHVRGVAEGIRIQGPAAGVSNQAFVTFHDLLGARIGYVGDGSTGDNDVFLNADLGSVILNTAAGRVLAATSTGNVGISTTAPQAKLDVRGDIRLGASGQLRAPGGEENLRIVRGVVRWDGKRIAGSGFEVSRNTSLGSSPYTITFTTPFASFPAVTATVDLESIPGFLGDKSYVVNTNQVTASSVVLTTRNVEGDFFDARKFYFMAVGPRQSDMDLRFRGTKILMKLRERRLRCRHQRLVPWC